MSETTLFGGIGDIRNVGNIIQHHGIYVRMGKEKKEEKSKVLYTKPGKQPWSCGTSCTAKTCPFVRVRSMCMCMCRVCVLRPIYSGVSVHVFGFVHLSENVIRCITTRIRQGRTGGRTLFLLSFLLPTSSSCGALPWHLLREGSGRPLPSLRR